MNIFMVKSITYLHLALSICRGDPLLPTGETRSATKASRPEREGDLAMNRRELILQGLRLTLLNLTTNTAQEIHSITPRGFQRQLLCGAIMSFPAKEFEVRLSACALIFKRLYYSVENH